MKDTPHITTDRCGMLHLSSGLWETLFCENAESMRMWDKLALNYPDGRSINWLRVCKITGKVVVHNKKCDCGKRSMYTEWRK